MIRFKPTIRSILAIAAATVATGGAALWLADRSAAVHTSDARVRASMVTISSDIAGRIVDLPVAAGDEVKAGDILARLDDREARLSIAALSLELKSLDAEVEREKLRVGLSKSTGESRVDASAASLAAAQADLLAAAAHLTTAEAEFERTAALKASGLVTQTRMERASTALDTARREEARARAAIVRREAGMTEARAVAGEAAAIALGVEALSLRAHALRQQIALRKVELSRHNIVSPIDGVIDEVFADRGEYVSPGARLALAHDPARVWIEANIKETEIARISDGAHVDVRPDSEPGRTCAGTIERIGNAATSEFALIPNANPTGVFTKITQRVPVLIAPDGACGRLRPGAMATLRIVPRGDVR